MIDVISISYGMGDSNPIDCVRFYSKESPNTAVVIRRSEVSPLLPDKSVPPPPPPPGPGRAP